MKGSHLGAARRPQTGLHHAPASVSDLLASHRLGLLMAFAHWACVCVCDGRVCVCGWVCYYRDAISLTFVAPL